MKAKLDTVKKEFETCRLMNVSAESSGINDLDTSESISGNSILSWTQCVEERTPLLMFTLKMSSPAQAVISSDTVPNQNVINRMTRIEPKGDKIVNVKPVTFVDLKLFN